MDLRAILERAEKKLAERDLTAAEASRLAGRGDIFRVFKRAVQAGRDTNVKTLEAIAAGLGVTEQWLLFGSDTAPNVELENKIYELEGTLAGLKEASAGFLSSIGLEDAQDFVDSLEEIARTAATSLHEPQKVHDLRQQALGLSVQAARQLRIK